MQYGAHLEFALDLRKASCKACAARERGSSDGADRRLSLDLSRTPNETVFGRRAPATRLTPGAVAPMYRHIQSSLVDLGMFPEAILFKAERGFRAALLEAAQRERQSASEYVRRGLRAALQADGIELPPFEPETGAPARRAA